MKRLWFLAAALLVLAACGGQTIQDSAEVEATETEVVTAETEVVTAETEVDAGADSIPAADIDLTSPILPEADPAVAGIIRDRDWTKGAKDPLVVIVEYGDFQ